MKKKIGNPPSQSSRCVLLIHDLSSTYILWIMLLLVVVVVFFLVIVMLLSLLLLSLLLLLLRSCKIILGNLPINLLTSATVTGPQSATVVFAGAVAVIADAAVVGVVSSCSCWCVVR